jgi:hypothetical protein
VVLRHEATGVVAVGQAAHAWLCGQLARAWGNARFGAVAPLDEVVLGAEQHDVGMAEWDLRPMRNHATGLPQSFMEMAVAENLGLWRDGPSRLITQSPYAALLAAMHGRRLYARRDLNAAPREEAELVRDYLVHSEALEHRLRSGLVADDVEIARNSALVWTWDSLSLGLLLDWAPFTLHAVPAADGQVLDIAVTADGVLAPWPFATAGPVVVHCDGRRLTGTYDSDSALQAALDGAPWETLRFRLQPPADPAPTI